MAITTPLAPRLAALAAGLALLLAAGPAGAQGAKGLTALTIPPKVVASDFGPNPALTCSGYGTVGIYTDGLARAAKERGQAAPAADGRLCAAAAILLDWKSDDVPAPDVLLFLARGVGLLNPAQQVLLATLETEEPRDITRALAGSVLDFAAKAVAPRYGLATKRLRGKSTRVVLLVQDLPFEVGPLPRQLPLNGTATFSGRLLGDLEKPAVQVSDSRGKLEEPPQGPGREFKAEVRCGDRPGRIFLVLRAEQGGQPRKLAGIPVACGGEAPPATLSLEVQGWPPEPAAQSRLIFDQVNAERTAVGLAALAWDDALAGVARELTADLAKEGTPPGEAVTARLAKVGLGSPLVLQNPGQSTSAKLAAEGFLESPGHRANLMHPDANTGAVGVVVQPGPDGKSAAFVTELFIQVLPPLDPAKVRGEVRAGLIQRRAGAKAAPASSDPLLEELAQGYAAAMAAAGREDLPESKVEVFTQPLSRKYKDISLVSGARPDPMAFAVEPTLLSKAGKGLGVGVAQGTHPNFGKNAVYVVVIIATKR
jgi:uncharacterized protein YkwD